MQLDVSSRVGAHRGGPRARAAVMALGLAGAGCYAPALEADDVERAARGPSTPEAVRPAVLRLRGGDGSGSGAIVARDGDTYYLLTNAHVRAQVGDRPQASDAGDTVGTATFFGEAADNTDIAVYTLRSAFAYPAVRLCRASKGQSVVAIGFPAGKGLLEVRGTLRSTEICDPEGYSLFFGGKEEAWVEKGMSGGATVLGTTYCLAGINGKHPPLWGKCEDAQGKALDEELCKTNKSVAIEDAIAHLPEPVRSRLEFDDGSDREAPLAAGDGDTRIPCLSNAGTAPGDRSAPDMGPGDRSPVW